MSENEIKAREILTELTKTGLGLEPLYAAMDVFRTDTRYKGIGPVNKFLPVLTNEECKAIAVNYPISFQSIREVFPRGDKLTYGQKIYDPRVKKFIVSNNPALIMGDMIRNKYVVTDIDAEIYDGNLFWDNIEKMADMLDEQSYVTNKG